MASDSSISLNSSQAEPGPAGKTVYQFDEFVLDPEACTLTRGTEIVPLPSKVFELLLVLVRSHERVVPKQEIFDEVWAGASVEESNLTQSIFVLRKALGQTPQKRFVATFPGKGYRFVVPVSRQALPARVAPAHANPRTATGWLTVATLLIAAASTLVWSVGNRQVHPVDQFWEPIFANPHPAVICFSSIATFDLGPDFRRRFVRSDPQAKDWIGSEVLPIPPTEVVRGDQISPVVNQFVGIGSAFAMAAVTGVFARAGKDSAIEMATQTTFSTMRAHPVVLIGGFNNAWTLQLAKDARFVFESDAVSRRMQIKDRQTGTAYHFPPGGVPHDPIEDFAIVSRVADRSTGEPLVVIAGITQYGTRAAGELVSSDSVMGEAVKLAPADWARRNVQFLLRAKVVRGVPARPVAVAAHVW